MVKFFDYRPDASRPLFNNARIRPRFTEWEIVDILKSWIALTGAYLLTSGFIVFIFPIFVVLRFPLIMATTGLTFVAHELGHKFTAQRFNLEAHYQANNMMLLIGLAISLSGFLFFAPGAVVIEGGSTRKTTGIIAAAGPLANITLGIACLILSILFPFIQFFEYAFRISAWVALFNMIPFGMFDGRKIIAWNKVAFGLIIATAGVLVALYYLLPLGYYYWFF
jgi:Zn-dependent protease